MASDISRISTLSSVTNAVRVLKAFSTTDREWGVSDLARKLDLAKSTTHRLLATLADEGMLEQTDNGRYRLGLAIFDLAAAVPTQFDLHEAILTPLTDLRNRTGETVQVGVLDGREVVYIERLDSPQTTRMFMQVGRRNAAHCSSTGKVLLANLPRTRRRFLMQNWEPVALTEHSITSLEKLDHEFDLIRHQGYATNQHEAEVGVVSIAAPIRDHGGRVIAALSVAGPADRVDPLNQRLVLAVLETGNAVSRRLGHRGVS